MIYSILFNSDILHAIQVKLGNLIKWFCLKNLTKRTQSKVRNNGVKVVSLNLLADDPIIHSVVNVLPHLTFPCIIFK